MKLPSAGPLTIYLATQASEEHLLAHLDLPCDLNAKDRALHPTQLYRLAGFIHSLTVALTYCPAVYLF